MATKIEESVKKETPVLKKRTAPGETKTEKSVSPLKKRELPTSKKELSDSVITKSEPSTESKGKSSLDKMRERIAAQKKLEQDMMTKQSLKNKEKTNMRNKLSALSKEISEQEEETVVKTTKQTIDFDLKTEALETQNKKLKSDSEKINQKMQALLALEYENVKVLDDNNITLSDGFMQLVNAYKEQAENKVDNQVVIDLEKLLKDKEALINNLENEKTKLVEKNNSKVQDIKEKSDEQIKELNKINKEKEKQIEKLTSTKEALTIDKQELQKENKKLSNQVNSLITNLSEKEKEIQDRNKLANELEQLKKQVETNDNEKESALKEELDKAFANAKDLENKIKLLEEDKKQSENLLVEKKLLENQLNEQANKIDELLMNYQVQIDEKDKELDSLRKEILEKEKKLDELNKQISILPSSEQYKELNDNCNKFEEELTLLKEEKEKLLASNEELKEKQNSQYNVNVDDLFFQIELRNQLLQKLCDEKKDIIAVLKKSGKNTQTIEKQIEEINALINPEINNEVTEEQVVYLEDKTERVIESIVEQRNKEVSEEVENIIRKENEVIIDNNEKVHRIKIEDNIGQKDLGKIKGLQEEIASLEFKLNENKEIDEELKNQYDRFVSMDKKLTADFKVIRKYLEFMNEYKIVNKQTKVLSHDITLMNPKQDKKTYRAKLAETKSMNHKADYLNKQIKKLMKNKHVIEYVKLKQKLVDFEKQLKEIEKRNDEIKMQISQKQLEINSLKG